MKRRMVTILVSVTGLLVLGFGALLLASLACDESNPRDRPNTCYIEVSTPVDAPVAQAYEFVKYRLPDVYRDLTCTRSSRLENLKALIERSYARPEAAS